MTKKRMLFSSGRSVNMFLGTAALLLMTAGMADAQSLEFSSSLNPVGSGARAVGMGGAFIGVADDATAASWNPAGLIQLEKGEVSVVYANMNRKHEYAATALHPELATTSSMSTDGINYMSTVFNPFVLFDHNVIVSINYQRLYEMEKHVLTRFDVSALPDYFNEEITFDQTGYLYALSPAFAVQAGPSLSFGMTLNFWNDLFGRNGWNEKYKSRGSGVIGLIPTTDSFTRTSQIDFDGLNANLGLLWSASSAVTIGAVYKSGFNAHIARSDQSYYEDDQGTYKFSDTEEQMTLRMPPSYGVGVQYRPFDELTVDLDVYRTEWSKFVMVRPDGTEINPLSGTETSFGRSKSTTQVRLGAEYLFIGTKGVVAVRGGIFSDPSPARGQVDDASGFSLGTGYATANYSADLAYQYRSGDDMTGDVVTVTGSTMDVTEQTLMLSLIYYFE